jgi:outer membrane protein TolC
VVLPKEPAAAAPQISPPASLPEQVTLAEVLALALANNPQTRASWLAAQAASAEVGRKRAAYFPSLDASFGLTRQSQWALGGRFSFQQTSYGPALSLTYLLLDFGGRSAKVEEAFQGLLAADFSHNATLQEVLFQVEKAYFSYLKAVALQEAAQASVRDAQNHLEAAQARKELGLATLLDVLQARTALAQAKLQLANFQGQVESVRGALATAMGFSATVAVNVVATLPEIPQLRKAEKVEDLVAQALLQRPEVQKARAQERQAQAKLAATKAEGLPTLSAFASGSRSYYQPQETKKYGDNWSLGLTLRWPLFTDFDRTYAILQAEAQAKQAQTFRQLAEQQASLEVWTASYQVTTARARLEAASEFLAAATQTQEVAEGRFREGVGSMLDVT